MHYPVRDAILRLLYAGTLDIPHFAEKVESLFRFYPRDHATAMYVLLGSHDTERLLTKVEGSVDKAKLAFLFQFAYPGAPSIYYGDEIGLQGGKDPDCRATFPWEESRWNKELRLWVKKLISVRKRRAVLRRGEYIHLCAEPSTRCLAFARTLGEEKIVVVLNASPEKLKVNLPVGELGWSDGQPVRSLLSRKRYAIEQGELKVVLPPLSGDWIG
jgi:glycosidase